MEKIKSNPRCLTPGAPGVKHLGFKCVFSLLLFFLFFFVLAFYYAKTYEEKKLDVTFLDVEQGDASLIRTPFGQNILIDAGEGKVIMKRLGEELPWWDKQIDLLILSHPHSDHLGGMIDVLRRYEVLEVLYTGVRSEEADFALWLELTKKEGVAVKIIDHPQKIILGENCSLEIIFPFDRKILEAQKNLNNTSVIAKLEYGELNLLFMGDAEAGIEKILIDKGIDMKADLLKVGHHGSDTSSSEDFLKAVGMEFAVVSVGKENDFGHPSVRTLNKLKRTHTQILRTDIEGSIKFESDGKSLYNLK